MSGRAVSFLLVYLFIGMTYILYSMLIDVASTRPVLLAAIPGIDCRLRDDGSVLLVLCIYHRRVTTNTMERSSSLHQTAPVIAFRHMSIVYLLTVINYM